MESESISNRQTDGIAQGTYSRHHGSRCGHPGSIRRGNYLLRDHNMLDIFVPIASVVARYCQTLQLRPYSHKSPAHQQDQRQPDSSEGASCCRRAAGQTAPSRASFKLAVGQAKAPGQLCHLLHESRMRRADSPNTPPAGACSLLTSQTSLNFSYTVEMHHNEQHNNAYSVSERWLPVGDF